MNRCKDCKWFARYANSPDRLWGACDRAEGVDGRQRDPQTLAFARDAEYYHAVLDVHEDFGCVQWEPKP